MMSSFWALNYPLVKIALSYESPTVLLFFRVLFATLFSLLLFWKNIELKISRNTALKVIVLSLFNVVLFMELWFYSENFMSAPLTSVLIYTYPIISTVLSISVLQEKVNMGIIVGIILGFTGMIIVFSYNLGVHSFTGPVIALLAALSWSLGTLFFKKFINNESKETVNFYQFLFALPVTFILVILSGQLNEVINPTLWSLFIAALIGIPGTAFAYFAFLHLNRDYSMAGVSSLLFVVPALSTIFSLIILNQSLELVAMVGLALISVGTFFSSGVPDRLQARQDRDIQAAAVR